MGRSCVGLLVLWRVVGECNDRKNNSPQTKKNLRQAVFSTWHRRWSGIISIAGQRALTASLLSLPEVYGASAYIPSLDDVLEVERENIISPEMAIPCGRGGVVGL